MKKAQNPTTRRRKQKRESLATSIYRVLKKNNSNMGISRAAMSIMEDFVMNAFRTLMKDAVELCGLRKRVTITPEDIRSSVLLNFPVELGKEVIEEGFKSCETYELTKKNTRDQRTITERSALIFPVGRIHRFMRAYVAGDGGKSGGCGNRKNGPSRVQAASPVFMAAVLETLTSKLTILSAQRARDGKKIRICPRMINLASREDLYLSSSDVVIRSGGVVPFIHSLLLPKKS